MRLTAICQMFGRKPHGFLYRGKNRKLRPVTMKHLMELKRDLEREEDNMLWLRHPYLTMEEDVGHMIGHPNRIPFEQRKLEWQKLKMTKWCKPVKITDRLKCLMVQDAWE